MKREFTFGNAIAIFIPTIIIILGWTNSINSAVKVNKTRIEIIEDSQEKIEEKIDKIFEITTEILVKIENKKDR